MASQVEKDKAEEQKGEHRRLMEKRLREAQKAFEETRAFNRDDHEVSVNGRRYVVKAGTFSPKVMTTSCALWAVDASI